MTYMDLSPILRLMKHCEEVFFFFRFVANQTFYF